MKIHKSFSKDFLPRKQRYEYHRSIFNGRNSYSKTDHDATFMRMKEDHMRNGQLKPGYNVQVGTENGFVTTYRLYANPTDTRTLIPHLEHFNHTYGHRPEKVIADKGYGSFENYEELESQHIEAYIKYPHWDQEKKKRSNKYRYRSWRFTYDKVADELICPEGKRLLFVTKKRRMNYNKDGYRYYRLYRCYQCHSCEQRSKCTKREYRTVEVNLDRLRLYKKARDRLSTENGKELYRKRGVEVETVFGQIKGNLGYRRLSSWGKEQATCNWAIHMIGYNIKQLALKSPI